MGFIDPEGILKGSATNDLINRAINTATETDFKLLKKLKIILNKKKQLQFMLLFFGILAAAIFEMVGVGSIPVFLNLLLKPEEVFSYLPSNKYLNLLAAQDYFNQILIGGALLLITGILMITNQLQAIGFYLLKYIPILQKIG